MSPRPAPRTRTARIKPEPYKVIDHTADIGLRGYGRTLEELFVNLGRGTLSLITHSPVEAVSRVTIRLEEQDNEALLVSWLNELIYYFEVKGMLFSEFESLSIDKAALEAVALGEKYDPLKHEVVRELKACTYHLVKVENTREGWSGKVIFDV